MTSSNSKKTKKKLKASDLVAAGWVLKDFYATKWLHGKEITIEFCIGDFCVGLFEQSNLLGEKRRCVTIEEAFAYAQTIEKELKQLYGDDL